MPRPTLNKLQTILGLTLLGLLALLGACGGGSSDGSGGSGNVPPPVTAPTALSYPSPQTYVVGTTIAALNPTVTGAVTTYTVSPALPAGLTLNATTGQIGGTPSAPTAMAIYVLRAENSAGAATFSLAVTVNAAPTLAIEPIAGTTLGIDQVIDLFAAYKQRSTDPFPIYVDAAQVSWSSSQPGVAQVGSNGQVRGISEGSTTITAQYLSLTRQITLTVGGSFSSRTIAIAGQGARAYSLLTPSGVAPGTALPVLLAIHGGGGTARINASTSLLSALAQQRKVLVVYTEGTGLIQTYNAGACCGTARTNNVDDVAYFHAVLNDLAARDNIDSQRIYSTGFSNGGMMSHRLACAMSDRIAGIAAVGGASGQYDRQLNQYYSCNPARPIPILIVHAANDRNYPYAGGFGDGLSDTDFYPVDSTANDWITRNNVSNQGVIENVTPTTTCTRFATRVDTSRPSAAVTKCRVDPIDVFDAATGIVFGGGHSWPGGNRSLSAGSDTPLQDFNANTYLWNFFSN